MQLPDGSRQRPPIHLPYEDFLIGDRALEERGKSARGLWLGMNALSSTVSTESNSGGNLGSDLEEHIAVVGEVADKIMDAGGEFTHESMVPYRRIVKGVLGRWETIADRNSLGQVIMPGGGDADAPVSETEQALVTNLIESLKAVNRKVDIVNVKTKKGDAKEIEKLVSIWPADFIINWFNGNSIDEWKSERDFSAYSEEQMQEFNKFTPAYFRKWAISKHPHEPFEVLDRLKAEFESTYSDIKVTEFFGLEACKTDEAASILPYAARLQLFMHVGDPMAAMTVYRDFRKDPRVLCQQVSNPELLPFGADITEKLLQPQDVLYAYTHFPKKPVQALQEWLAGKKSFGKHTDEGLNKRFIKLASGGQAAA